MSRELLTAIHDGDAARWTPQPIWAFADDDVDLFEIATSEAT